MSDSNTKFSLFLAFGDITFGVSLSKQILYDELAEYARKKLRFNDTSEIMFTYKVGERCVHIVDDEDVKFFVDTVCNSTGIEHTLFIKKIEKCLHSNPSSSKPSSSKIFDIPFFRKKASSKTLKTEPKNKAIDTNENLWKKNSLKYIPPIPSLLPIIKSPLNTSEHRARVLKSGDRFDSKELLMYEIGYKALLDGYEFKARKTDKSRYDVICRNEECKWKIISSKCKSSNEWVIGTINDRHTCAKTQFGMHHRNATAKLLARLIEPKYKDPNRVYKPKDIKKDIYMDLNIDISYKQALRSKHLALKYLSGDPIASFAQLPVYCYNLELISDGNVTHIETDNEDRFTMVFIAFGVVIRSFKNHMRPLIIIDAAHLKGTYEGTNLLAVGMDGNNQIIPIATGVSHVENGPSWTWFLTKLKECIGDIPGLSIVSDRHAAIKSACSAVFPNAFHFYCCRHLMMNCKLGQNTNMQSLFWKLCKAYTPEEFNVHMNELEGKRPDVHQRLIEAGVERWSRAYSPNDRYNYMTSNSAESINNLTKEVRKLPITNLMKWYSDLVQEWYCEKREKCKDAEGTELSDWATRKITKRKMKSVNWIVGGIDVDRVYYVDDRRKIHTVELFSATCTCRKWQLSGLPCGHVLAVCRVKGITDCNHLAQGWFRRTVLKATYQELVYTVGEVSSWLEPNDLQVVKPPIMVLQPKKRGRPRNNDRILSEGEVPIPTRCGRCGARGHKRNSCREHIPQTNTRTSPTRTSHQGVYYSHQQHYNTQQAYYTSQQAHQAHFYEQQVRFYSQQEHQAQQTSYQGNQGQQAYFQASQADYNSQHSQPFSNYVVNLNDP